MTRFACKLADLVFILSARYPTAERYCREYIVPSAKGIAISYSDEDMRREREKTGMPPPLCELSLLYREICRKLLFHDGMVFHASVVAVANRAYGFTAPSGTGKSTHAAQWRLKFDSAAVMVMMTNRCCGLSAAIPGLWDSVVRQRGVADACFRAASGNRCSGTCRSQPD